MEHSQDLPTALPLAGMLGYLNFSGGKPDARFEKQLSDAYQVLAARGETEPWRALQRELTQKLDQLQAGESGAFKEADQVRAVLALVFERCLPAYRRHHADLLFHLADADLFSPFFLARTFEAVLTQGSPWDEVDRIVTGALAQLNDFVGHRPVAILETRPRGEPYSHERVRPIPLFIRGAGVAWGRYQPLVAKALEILGGTDASLLAEACFDLDLLDELALDPRPYDQGHPVHRRPNYVFGEWDPDHIDNQGRFRRLIVRRVILEGLLDRVEHPGPIDPAELLFEAAAVLAGTVLMAAGVSGTGPGTYDSTTTLSTLMPRIARYRDTYYANLLGAQTGAHGNRLRQEAVQTRQPFGRARQHLNEYLSTHRARQLQHRQLALLFAAMGYPEASRTEAARIPAASVRLLSEILGRLTSGHFLAERGQLAAAAQLLPDIEDFLQRGIHCGAVVDPWNILGFQGLFPLFQAREDSVRDTRIDDLVLVVEQVLNLYSRLMSEAAAAGEKDLIVRLKPALRRFGAWWDRFASVEVQDVRRVHGGEAVKSAEHVATALGRWHDQGEATSDLAFWKRHLEGFRSPKAFALVIEALLAKDDYKASMALFINWIGQVEQVPLEDGNYSFHALTLRWLLGLTGGESDADKKRERFALVKKFFDYLEANAGEYGQVPSVGPETLPPPTPTDEEDEDLYGAAYEDVTYQDSADDNQEGAVWDGGAAEKEFLLDAEGELIGKRLRFLATLARLWQIAARQGADLARADGGPAEAFGLWSTAAQANLRGLFVLMDALHEYPIPEPLGSHESMVEYDRRRTFKEQLVYTAIGTCLDTALAAGALRGALGQAAVPLSQGGEGLQTPAWEPAVIQLEEALWRGDRTEAERLVPVFLEPFEGEPLLFTSLADGGRPRQIFWARLAQTVLRALVANLPRLGLLRQTYHLLKAARAMEGVNRPEGRGVSEFSHLCLAGYGAVVEAVVDSAADWAEQAPDDRQLAGLLEALTAPFLSLWAAHSQTLQLSSLETLRTPEEWVALRELIRRYGGDLFHARFMTLANLRGILHRGVGAYLDYLSENPDPLHPVGLIDDLDSAIPRAKAERLLEFVLRALVENYEEYKDYNTTTAQSDYGQNLYMLLDFLRLKAHYERQAWQFRPLVLAHEILARKGRGEAAVVWQQAFAQLAQGLAGRYLEELARLEQAHGLRLRTVSDRLQERFVKPLTIDRLCALIDPAMEEARQPEPARAFARLEQEIAEQTAIPTGVGLDVPPWLRRLEAEVQRFQARHTAVAVMADQLLQVPRQGLSFAELQRQLQDWEKPL